MHLKWSKIIVVQPWFSALGHPAQSTLNLSRIVPADRVRYFLLSPPSKDSAVSGIASAVAQHVPVRKVCTFGNNIRWNTLMAVRSLRADNIWKGERDALFFLDADIFVICAAVWLRLLEGFSVAGLVLLSGPEAIERNLLKRLIVRGGMRSGTLLVFLRTEELLRSWQACFPDFSASFRLYPPVESAMPTLASPSAVIVRSKREAGENESGVVRIGVIGQIRIGKYIPELILAAEQSRGSIRLAVYGPLYERQPNEFLEQMRSSPLVHPGFLSEPEMLHIASDQHYLASFLEKDRWDLRMEAATFWLGIKVGTPVLCFDDGWLGRMVRDTGAGIVLQSSPATQGWLDDLPREGSVEYRRCLENINRFRSQLKTDAIWTDLERNLG